MNDMTTKTQEGELLPVKEFLTFALGNEAYGIDILRVQEIRSMDQITRVPRVESYVRGVINLRGIIAPVFDLRMKFGFAAEITATTSTIVLNCGDKIIGIVVDNVSDVVGLIDSEIRPTPDFGSAMSGEYIAGLGVSENRMILLLNLDRLMQEFGLA